MHEVGCYLGIAIANLVGALNVRRILVAGSMARFGEGLLGAVREQVRARVLTNLAEQTTIDISALGADIVLLGTAALLLDKELSLV